jgi:glycerol dehydrogenase
MMQKAVFPGQYIQGIGLVQRLAEFAGSFRKRALLLASPRIIKSLKQAQFSFFETIVPEAFGGECSRLELKRISEIIASKRIDVIIGMGGGKAIDTAKITADWADIPVIVVPTIASTDAPCSGCAVCYSPQGVFEEVLFQKRNPALVLVDLQIIAEAPVRFLVSGMGDALATWFEARSVNATKSYNECGGLSTLAGRAIARICYDTLLEYGMLARIANLQHIVSPAFANIVEANILLSGIGFESCGIASAHAIHNGLTRLPETHAFYHGEKVAFGVLAGLHLTGASSQEIEEVYSFCEEIGLPLTFAELGITNPQPERLMALATASCEPASSIHKEAGIITAEMVYKALLMADALGRTRRGQSI